MSPIGGSNIGWDNTSPPDTESAGLGDDRIRSMKSSIQETLDNEHNFPSGGGANTGYHRMGSARPFYGVQSLVSSSGSDARLMVTSDTSRLFGVGSAGTVFFGGATVLSVGTYPGTVPQRHYWAMEIGTGVTSASGVTTILFANSGYSGAPNVQVTRTMAGGGSSRGITIPTTINNVGFDVASYDETGTLTASITFNWISVGSRVL